MPLPSPERTPPVLPFAGRRSVMETFTIRDCYDEDIHIVSQTFLLNKVVGIAVGYSDINSFPLLIIRLENAGRVVLKFDKVTRRDKYYNVLINYWREGDK